jgi:hypothetical protein
MNLNTTFTIRQSVLSRPVGDETVILELEGGAYFGLDPIGARVWTLVSEGTRLGKLCEIMVSEYEVERAQLERDVEALISDLVRRRLVAINEA